MIIYLPFCVTENDIETFMKMYRKNFPYATTIPKMHFLEDHMIEWVRRYN